MDRIRDLIEQNSAPTGQTLEDLDCKGPTSVPGYCYYTPAVNLESFLLDKLQK